MTIFVALLRAVNVGGRKLLMTDLRAIADELGLAGATTFIASGNLLFTSSKPEAVLKGLLEERLSAHMGAAVGVMIRTAEEMARIVEQNPFADAAGNRVVVIFLDHAPPADTVESARSVDDERIAPGEREVFVAYGEKGMGRSRLRIPRAESGTARNMNSVAKLARIAKEMS
jgi:uncharacterized protein (DUF1697 family)